MPKSPSSAPLWVGTTAAAHLLGIVPRTLYRIIDEGDLPAYRMGRVLRLRVRDIDEYVESLRVQPGDLTHLYPPGPHLEDPDNGATP